MDIPQPGDKITVNGIEYLIRDVEVSGQPTESGLSVFVRTHPQPCGDAWEDEDSFGYGHECRLPKGHTGDHVCGNQDDDQDYCRWTNWADTPTP